MTQATRAPGSTGAGQPEHPQPHPPGPLAPRRTLATPRPNTVAAALAVVALLAAGVWSLVELRINAATLLDSADNAADFLGRMLPLDFPPAAEIAGLVGETLAIVIAATLLSVLLSVPVAIWAAANTTPNPSVRYAARALIVISRAIPDLVLAIVFLRIFGLGALTGVLAMGLHSVGMVAKLYADAVEQIDEGPRTAIRATGAGRRQELRAGVIPQVVPAFVATAMHRLDINLRISVLLGFVGVGGIGLAISQALEIMDYQRGMALALVVLVLCVAMELISGAVRRAVLGPAAAGAAPTGLTGFLSRTVRPRRRTGEPQRPSPRGGDPRADSAAALRVGRTRPPWTARRVLRTGYVAIALGVVAAALLPVARELSGIAGAGADAVDALQRFWPPEHGGILPALLDALLVTVQIALAATLLGAILALPVGVLAARNVAPNARIAQTLRMFIVFVRGVPELILAIVFVVMIGLGPVAGTLALAIGAVGLLGKLVADSVEEVDPGSEQALRTTGASRTQVFFGATLPQALPAFVAHLLYQLDVNIRSATLLGIVGAGGIGFYLLNAARVLEFGVVTFIVLLLFAVVMAVEVLAMWLRRSVGAAR
ncbi:phosphonate ABC transporter, permease protein PhnE [Lipingzhangella sp. LS1_29]|uniref:Phosphonate ABC transporter, permease protein PhnE n=1 Tax=Lipingzhangella rawalii TaxID=2055835 RepID=A0ABU2H910_9ACTN|nr:phosphonate ABC transporter, permease protein PhnE [Lipingzhangella rawalii]MDS1271335.1 phosphonate ABC transporter, permease protein PhnE [Lipingzhangella rawalii]